MASKPSVSSAKLLDKFYVFEHRKDSLGLVEKFGVSGELSLNSSNDINCCVWTDTQAIAHICEVLHRANDLYP